MARDNIEILRQIDDKVAEIEELVQELYTNNAVKNQLVRYLIEFQEEVEDSVDLQPTDWE